MYLFCGTHLLRLELFGDLHPFFILFWTFEIDCSNLQGLGHFGQFG